MKSNGTNASLSWAKVGPDRWTLMSSCDPAQSLLPHVRWSSWIRCFCFVFLNKKNVATEHSGRKSGILWTLWWKNYLFQAIKWTWDNHVHLFMSLRLHQLTTIVPPNRFCERKLISSSASWTWSVFDWSNIYQLSVRWAGGVPHELTSSTMTTADATTTSQWRMLSFSCKHTTHSLCDQIWPITYLQPFDFVGVVR